MTEKRFTCEVTDTGLWYIETITDNFEMNTFDDVETVTELLNKFSEENEQLKFERDRYKRLSEIRQESINNRILTIKEFIDNCSDKKVKKTLEQLFYSEVKEYDLSKKIRKLEKENEQLKQQIEELEFKLRTIEAYDRTVKEEHSDTVYDFKKKLEKW